jgi:dipeptidyl aminopeptidase/acylaminoacyl peptidase
LIHGRDDDSVPPSHSIAMADALRSSGVRAELMVIAGVGHSFELDLKDQDLENAVVRFLEGVWSSRRSLASH